MAWGQLRRSTGLIVCAACILVLARPAHSQWRFVRGDVDQDGKQEISDPIGLLEFLFQGGKEPACRDAADVDDSGRLDLSDPVVHLEYLFQGGPQPAAPFPSCGADGTPDRLDCKGFQGCAELCSHPAAPVLCSLEADGEVLAPGDVVALVGINFSPDLAEDRVDFVSGSVRIQGLPIRAEFPSDGKPENGLESRLSVVVPTGIRSGVLELNVGGVAAGSFLVRARPEVFSAAIGPSGQEPYLIRSWPEGFHPPYTVILSGVNFEEATHVVVTDRFGVEAEIPRSKFIGWDIPGRPANNLQFIQISMRDAEGLALETSPARQRDDIALQVAAGGIRSNRAQVPLTDAYSPSKLPGPAVNGILVPPGVRTGPVRIRYSIYDHPRIEQVDSIDVRWSADGGKTFFPALPDLADPENDGARVNPGDIDFGPATGLLFSGGALKTFTWDAPGDENLKALRAAAAGGSRAFTIRFRVHPYPEYPAIPEKQLDPDHFFESPPMAYFDLEDREGVDYSLFRRGEIAEGFSTDLRADPACTTAFWGPPENPGELRGAIPPDAASEFGAGTFDLVLAQLDPPPQGAIAELIVVDTDRMKIERLVMIDDGTSTGVETYIPLFPSDGIANPGEDRGEFHLRALAVESDADVRLVGSRPAVFRISAEGLDESTVSVRIDGSVYASGEAGENATGTGTGKGGKGGPGGGDGGDGARLTIDDQGEVIALGISEKGLVPAGSGGNGGGGGGGTAAAIDPNQSVVSRFLGAPGGGGGHRLPGMAGDPGIPRNPAYFIVPRGGRGGPRRGSSRLVPLTAGSGGGGGGATISRPAGYGTTAVAMPGAGGGGGGGAIQIAARGDMRIAGKIMANGGKGGNGNTSGPGGGGSGGAILLQATGKIEAGCENLEVLGGAAGTMSGQNQTPGAGAGAPGRIRLEPGRGGGLFCGVLAFETVLTVRMSATTPVSAKIMIRDATGFPPSGVVRIDDELIAYRRVAVTSLEELTRGYRGTAPAEHLVGTPVILESTVQIPASLVTDGGQIHESPDAIPSGSVADGAFQAYFLETIDPATGNPLTDPETGREISLWTLDTDTSTIRDPSGKVALTAAAAQADPGLFSFRRLRIDEDVVLRAAGSRPLRILASEAVEIIGTLDLSGQGGGPLRFDPATPHAPLPGLGGRGGPGAGDGGDGGSFLFPGGYLAALADPTKIDDPGAATPVPAEHGGLPAGFPPLYDRTGSTSGSVPPPDDLTGLETTRATPGDPLREPVGPSCTPAIPCTAGGGGGGGARTAGASGEARPADSTAFGRGGSIFNLDSFRFGGGLSLLGGQGGAGGGASAVVSPDYFSRQAGEALFQGAAKFAPGTGGGGGGGVLYLAVQGDLLLRRTGRILARGGSAFQSIDLAGNGGAGAGGSVLVQVAGSLDLDPEGKIDTRGGQANLPPPIPPGSALPIHEGNIRRGASGSGLLRDFGGSGGDGAPGRIRFEAPPGSNLLRSGLNDSLVSGTFIPGLVPSRGCSTPIPSGVGPGGLARSHEIVTEGSALRFAAGGPPAGTEAILLWSAAEYSLDLHGALVPLPDGTEDPVDFRGPDSVLFSVWLFSNRRTGAIPAVDEVQLDCRLED